MPWIEGVQECAVNMTLPWSLVPFPKMGSSEVVKKWGWAYDLGLSQLGADRDIISWGPASSGRQPWLSQCFATQVFDELANVLLQQLPRQDELMSSG